MGVRFTPASTEFGSLEPILKSWAEWYMPVTLALDRVQIGGSLKLIDASQSSRSDELQAQRDTLSQKERVMCDWAKWHKPQASTCHTQSHPFHEEANVLLEIWYLDGQHNWDSYAQAHGVCYRQDLYCDSDLSRTYWLSVTFLNCQTSIRQTLPWTLTTENLCNLLLFHLDVINFVTDEFEVSLLWQTWQELLHSCVKCLFISIPLGEIRPDMTAEQQGYRLAYAGGQKSGFSLWRLQVWGRLNLATGMQSAFRLLFLGTLCKWRLWPLMSAHWLDHKSANCHSAGCFLVWLTERWDSLTLEHCLALNWRPSCFQFLAHSLFYF